MSKNTGGDSAGAQICMESVELEALLPGKQSKYSR